MAFNPLFSSSEGSLQASASLTRSWSSLEMFGGWESLKAFMGGFCWPGALIEWGVPQGSLSRILPALTALSLQRECLWIADKEPAFVYPNAWVELGFDLNHLYFVNDEKAFDSLRTIVTQKSFPLIVLDSQKFLQKADFHFLAQVSRHYGLSFFLFRSFFLSNKRGNPFCRYRLNSSYNIIKQSFELKVVKGPVKTTLKFPFHKVFPKPLDGL